MDWIARNIFSNLLTPMRLGFCVTKKNVKAIVLTIFWHKPILLSRLINFETIVHLYLVMWYYTFCFVHCDSWLSNCWDCLQIAAICQEAGMHAVRKNRYVILPKDFEKGYRSNVKKPDTDFDFYKWLSARVEMLGNELLVYFMVQSFQTYV